MFLHLGNDVLARFVAELFFAANHRLIDWNIVLLTIAAQGLAVFKRIG